LLSNFHLPCENVDLSSLFSLSIKIKSRKKILYAVQSLPLKFDMSIHAQCTCIPSWGILTNACTYVFLQNMHKLKCFVPPIGKNSSNNLVALYINLLFKLVSWKHQIKHIKQNSGRRKHIYNPTDLFCVLACWVGVWKTAVCNPLCLCQNKKSVSWNHSKTGFRVNLKRGGIDFHLNFCIYESTYIMGMQFYS